MALTLAVLCMAIAPPSARAAASDPLWVFTPTPEGGLQSPVPAPLGTLFDPCGVGVDSIGNFYLSDYHHNVVDKYEPNADYSAVTPKPTGETGYLGQLSGSDPVDGPCGLAFDASDTLYANVYHRSVVRFDSPATSTPIAGQGIDSAHPTGVAVDPGTGYVYVDDRTYVAVYDSTGAPVMDGLEPLRIARDSIEGTLEDGYGIAVSTFPGTAGRIYVPDAATGTVKVYDPAVDKVQPVETIDGAATQPGRFISLQDSSIAVDRVTGEIYVVDDLQPVDTENPRALVDVFHPNGTYEGHLKFTVIDGGPSGLAVDNSSMPTQGRVYVTWGAGEAGSIYAYPPGAATTAPVSPPIAQLFVAAAGTGTGTADRDAGRAEPAASAGIAADPTGEAAMPRRAAHRRRHHRQHHNQRRFRHQDGKGSEARR